MSGATHYDPPQLPSDRSDPVGETTKRFAYMYNRLDELQRGASESLFMAAVGRESSLRRFQHALREISSVHRDLASEERIAAGDGVSRLYLYETGTLPTDFASMLERTSDAIRSIASASTRAAESEAAVASTAVEETFDDDDTIDASVDDDWLDLDCFDGGAKFRSSESYGSYESYDSYDSCTDNEYEDFSE